MAAVFHRLRPLTSITKSTLKSVVAKPGGTMNPETFPHSSLPRALSCSCLSVYRCHSAVMAAFVSFSTPDTQFQVGSSLQAGLYARPPVQSDYHAFKATSHSFQFQSLKTQRIATLLVATGNRFTERRCINAEFLK